MATSSVSIYDTPAAFSEQHVQKETNKKHTNFTSYLS